MNARSKRARFFLWVLMMTASIALINCAGGRSYQEVASITTRGDVKVNLEIYEPKNVTPKGIALMFPGGDGQINSSNFVVRKAAQFVDSGYTVVIMDVPSNMTGMRVSFRISAEHQGDIKKVIDYLKKRYQQKPIFTIAFSNGNYSTMIFPIKYPDSGIAGSVFMAAGWRCVFEAGNINQFATMPCPVLLVHHQSDGCGCFEYEYTKRYYELLRHIPIKNLLTVKGGSPSMRIGNECGPYHYHAFEGLEEKVTKAVIDWMDGRQIAETIDD